MRVAVIANEDLKKETQAKPQAAGIEFSYFDDYNRAIEQGADLYIDLLFSPEGQRIKKLAETKAIVLVNEVRKRPDLLHPLFARINGWPTLWKGNFCEVVCRDEDRHTLEKIFSLLHWEARFLPDITGMVTPRVISMLVNEAYFTWEQGVSSREDIDAAMRLGTNYPFGPFEWSQKIGIRRLYELLAAMCKEDGRYNISPTLMQEAKI